MALNISIPKGTRDFSPDEMIKRNYIFDNIKSVFQKFGYLPIETPAMETLETLMGKYGEEGDRLIFKILNSGDYFEKAIEKNNNISTSNKLTNLISEKALRYDLTVPFARFVVMNQSKINFPFKRYQIQPVWRADRPQKGRYREFYQCDVDVIGSNSLINELELIQIIDEIFQNLDIEVIIKINNRKILSGIAEYIGEKDKIIDITVAIDKLDKIGKEKVIEELKTKGLTENSINKLIPLFDINFEQDKKLVLNQLKSIIKNIEIADSGFSEIEKLFNYIDNVKVNCKVELDVTLARGLNYYTGAIFEVKAKNVSIGSICGGGRYDDLTGIFGLKDMSGVGVSFGADRIYDVLNELKKFPNTVENSTKVLFLNFGEKEEIISLQILELVRKNNIKAEIYPDNAKIKKQMNYANAKNIPFVVIIGENELINNNITLKNMVSGEQKTILINELLEIVKD